jgi:hypothetical protein
MCQITDKKYWIWTKCTRDNIKWNNKKNQKKLNILHTMYINFIYVGPHSLYIYRPKSRTEMASAIFQSEKTINKSLVELDDSLQASLFLPKLVWPPFLRSQIVIISIFIEFY